MSNLKEAIPCSCSSLPSIALNCLSALVSGLLICMLLLIFAYPVNGQTYNFRKYNVEDGLVQSYVFTMQQDEYGNLWMGTAAGLCKFDGKSFSTLTTKDGIAENYIISSYQDTSGNIWLGHLEGNISIYNYKTDSITIFDFGEQQPESIISKIFKDNNGDIWITTRGDGIYKYDGQAVEHFNPVKDRVANGCVDQNGNLWFAANKEGALFYNHHNWEVLNTDNGFPANEISRITCLEDGRLVIGTFGKGIYFITLGEGDRFDIRELSINDHPELTSSLTVRYFHENDMGLWIGTRTQGIIRIPKDESGRLQTRQIKVYNVDKGLSANNVYSILSDKEHNIWIGTLGGGVCRFGGEMFILYDEKDGIPHNEVWSVTQDDKEQFWISSNGGVVALNKLTANSDAFSAKQFTSDDGLPMNIVYYIHQDKNKDFWIGTRKGLSNYITQTGRFNNYEDVPGLSSAYIVNITNDVNGDLPIGTNKGISKYRFDQKKFEDVPAVNSQIGETLINCIYNNEKGSIWIGTNGKGLINYQSDQIKIYNESNGLEHLYVYSIVEDQSGNLWFGTQGGGLYRFDGNNFKHFSSEEGLSTDDVYLVVCDNQNNIWAGTSKGVDKFVQSGETIINYGKMEGFIGVETNRNAVLKDKEGNLWFGTVNGLVKYNPKHDKTNEAEPTTRITNLKIELKDAPFPVNNEFSYKENHLTFDFIAISLTIPEKVRYQYMLEGLETKWSPESEITFASYPNLSPGHYTFKVKACNNDGIWNKEPAVYEFEIIPPFWQTTWFMILCVVIIGTGLYIFYKLRVAAIERDRKVLAQKVKERTIEIEQKNVKLAEAFSELEEKNKDIMSSIQYAKRIQSAILPSDEQISDMQLETFILYKPRDIVSGDFYWVSERDNKLLFCAADCTGHGVPGAFMSMIGSALLNEIVNEKGIVKPSDILDSLREGVKNALKQTGAEGDQKDGMDIALCSLRKDNGMLEFAGAYNPLYLIRDNEVLETKANRQPIGMHIREKPFVNNEIEVKKGDSLYIFSDGYADQFGGPEGRKFNFKRFKELLVKVQEKPMEEQRQILDDTIESWRGEKTQLDDILVMGIRL